MARPSPTAAFLLLLLVSLLAVVAHCRTLEADPATDASSESTALVEAGDETVPAETGATTEVAVPTEQEGFLRLPYHWIHRHPCRHGHLKRHLWWVLRRGAFDDSLGGHRFHHHRGEARAHMTVDDAAAVHGEFRGAEEVESVAEPDPDRSVADGHDEDVAAVKPVRDRHDEEDAAAKPWRKEMVWSTFRDGHNAEDAAVKPWKKEMLWRMFRHGLLRHHRHHHHHEEEHEQEEEGTRGVKLFHHHHDADEEGEEKKMRRPFHFHHRHHGEENEEKSRTPLNHAEDSDSDSDDEDDEVEEMIRRFRKAIMRHRFGQGRRFHHHRHHQAEEGEQANGELSQAEEGGVVTWIKGLMNRF